MNNTIDKGIATPLRCGFVAQLVVVPNWEAWVRIPSKPDLVQASFLQLLSFIPPVWIISFLDFYLQVKLNIFY